MEKLILSIVTWNSESTIADCVSSVLAQTYGDFKVWIVDNNSQDGTCDIIGRYNDPRICLIRKQENTGFCGGHNFSIRNSSSEFVLLVNPDIILHPFYVENALATIEKDPRTGTVCGLLLQDEKSDPECIVDSAGLEKKRSGVMHLRDHGKKYDPDAYRLENIFGSDGALPLYRRSMIEDISYEGEFFDEMFFAHKEDWDVSWRAHIFGWQTIFDPACFAIHPRHFKPKSLKVRNNIASDIKVHSVKNQLILLLKNESFKSFLANSIFIIPRQLAIFLYVLFCETTSLRAYRVVIKKLHTIMKKRKVIQKHRIKK